MSISALRLCRSVLFLPASNSRAIEKARGLAADMVILDLEDAVRPADKAEARRAAVEAAALGFGDSLLAIRINGAGTPEYGDDAIALRGSKADFAVLPKAETASQIADTVSLVEMPVLAMVETPVGVLNAPALAHLAAGLIAGINDLALALGLPPGAGRGGMSAALQGIVLAARAAGVAAFDGVYNRLEDEAGLSAECEEGRAFGFDGKSLIHPSQIDTANRVFSPSQAEIEDALALIAAATGGAERYRGRMIESLHVEQARAMVAKARR
jgi:(3S)-malyl-CoA thioesterase